MKIRFLILLLLTSTLHYSQDIQYARKIIRKLCSKKFSGRGYVNQGSQKAANYITSEFDAIGLQKITPNYQQKFSVSVNAINGKLKIKLDKKKLKPGVDYLLNPGSPPLKGNFKIITISEEELITQKATELLKNMEGCFIAIYEAKRTLSTDEKIELRAVRTFLQSDKAKNSGLLLFSSKKLTWRGATSKAVKPIITIKRTFKTKPKTIKLIIESVFYPKYTTQNVVGYLKGTKYPDSLIVLTAHYDHLGKMGSKTYFLGANDNASGIAMLLNLAKKYAKQQQDYSMLFIAFGGEEIGLLGSKYYTENPLFPLENIKFLINFDLAGTGIDGIQVVNGAVYKKQFEKLKAINQKHHLLKHVKIRGEACNSDHCLFYRNNVPSFFIYTLGGIKAYHDIYDKPKTLPLTAFTNYFKLIDLFVEKI